MAARTYPTTATASVAAACRRATRRSLARCFVLPVRSLNEADDARAGPKRFRQEHRQHRVQISVEMSAKRLAKARRNVFADSPEKYA